MDVLTPSEDRTNYEDYYNAVGLEEFEPCKKTHIREFSNAFLPVFYSITCILSVVANLTLLIIFIKYKTLRKVFPVNIVISDIVFTLTLPFWAVYASSEWIFGYDSCKAITLVYMVSLYSSNLFVASLGLQRFLDNVMYNIKMFRSPKRNTIMCILVWLLSALAASVHAHFVETHEFDKQNTCTYHFGDKAAWKIYVRFQMNFLGFVIPFLVLLFCSIRLQCFAREGSTFQRHMPAKLETGFTIVFFLLWCPYSIVIFLHALQDLHVFYACTINIHFDVAIQVTECIAFLHVIVNPLLYVFLNKKIRRRLKGTCRTTREYLLEESNSSSVTSSQNGTFELRSVQRFQARDRNNSWAERPGNLIPEAT
ncbi:atypical chemokine receptor 2 [Triplophysa rosa]|uniref:Atypical chemokine receptor 2-like n=1 Tax=Triplophysa rosa TaxID=992332 RepID=A0A9W7WX32_TRIRA|nr:atypical chemokine receptor 2 [Triplophysa rosa]KAI7810257.1 putative atypical chemokine receptor 2-like [Triplophysa rosa]